MAQTKIETNQSVPEQKSKRMTIGQSFFAGSIAGATEVLVDHPLWRIKTLIQQGKSFTFKITPEEIINSPWKQILAYVPDPRIVYKGILPNAVSMVPTTAVQIGSYNFFQKTFFHDQELTYLQSLFAAFSAGVLSSSVSGPTELVLTQMKDKDTFYSAGSRVVNQGGWASLYNGLFATALRDGKFTLFFLGVTPEVKKIVQTYYPYKNVYGSISENNYSLGCAIVAGTIAGLGATIVSQPADTVKTALQSVNPAQSSKGTVSTIRELYSDKGIKGFFKGGAPRALRVVSAVTIMGVVGEEMKKAFTEESAAPVRVGKP